MLRLRGENNTQLAEFCSEHVRIVFQKVLFFNSASNDIYMSMYNNSMEKIYGIYGTDRPFKQLSHKTFFLQSSVTYSADR